MEISEKSRERIRAMVRDVLTRDDMSENEIADMVADETMEAAQAFEDQSRRDRIINRDARWTPVDNDPDSRPTVEVAGVFVSVWVEDGKLLIWAGLEEARESYFGGESVPMEFAVNGKTCSRVLWSADAQGHETAGEHEHCGAAGHADPDPWCNHDEPAIDADGVCECGVRVR
jgi:hypothetical protein